VLPEICGSSRGLSYSSNPRGAVVPGVSIIVEAKDFKRTVLTDGEGKYRVELSPGKYRITAEALAFRRFRQKKVVIEPKVAFKLNINLKFGKPIIVDGEHP
jgi:phospholipid N-methyltransferase